MLKIKININIYLIYFQLILKKNIIHCSIKYIGGNFSMNSCLKLIIIIIYEIL